MFRLYNFDFLKAVSEQLLEEYDTIQPSPLTIDNLAALRQGQIDNRSDQGVYLLTWRGEPKYIGKANDVAERLDEHRLKVLGRKGLLPTDVGYKVLLLDKSMGTAANERLIIEMFKERHSNMWNGSGFGPKDPGKNRDNTEASRFDLDHPINYGYVLNDVGNTDNLPQPKHLISDTETVSSLFAKMKAQLPYVLRYDFKRDANERPITGMPSIPLDLTGVPRNALAMLRAGMDGLAASGFRPYPNFQLVRPRFRRHLIVSIEDRRIYDQQTFHRRVGTPPIP
jgi:hypothetical protein